MKALSPGFFGPTRYDGQQVSVDRAITSIRIKCLNSKPDYLNLKEILIFNDHEEINDRIIPYCLVSQSSVYSKHSEIDQNSILLGKGTHTLKELEPWIELQFKPTYVRKIQILNRADIWGKRSKNLIVEVKAAGTDASWDLVFDATSDSYARSVYQEISETLSSYLPKPLLAEIDNSEALTALICNALKDHTLPIRALPWPLILKLVDIWSEHPSHSQTVITAAYLANQSTLGHETSFHNLAQPYMSESIVALLEALKQFESSGLIVPDIKNIISAHLAKSKEKSAWLDLENYAKTLLALTPNDPALLFDMGLAREKRGAHDDAREAYTRALNLSSRTTALHKYLFSSTHESIQCRIKLGDFIQENFQKIKTRAQQRPKSPDHNEYKIFSYWAQGLDEAPPIVKACHRQMLKHHPLGEIIYLDDTNFRYYVDIPDTLLKAVFHNKTFFSDVLRFYLLEKYGGIWIDSTCYLTAPIDTSAKTINEQRLTAFRRANKKRISVWFFAASRDSWIVKLICEALTEYWLQHDYVIDYFMLHHIFEILYFLDAGFRSEWDSHEQPLTSEAHRWYFKMHEKFTTDEFKDICAASNIHKLTYKVDAKIKSSDTFYSYAIRGFN